VRIRYPRIDAVWRAFATGTLAGVAGLTGGVARADCALPQHVDTVDPSTTPPKLGPDRTAGKKGGKKGKAEAVLGPTHTTGGVPVPVNVPEATPPVPGLIVPVLEKKKDPDPVQEKPAPKLQRPDVRPSHIDGGVGAVQAPVGRTIVVHAHGPDEPCHEGRMLFIRFDDEEPA
jgi:hypothetical protein